MDGLQVLLNKYRTANGDTQQNQSNELLKHVFGETNNNNNEVEVEAKPQKASLICPIKKMRMKYPCRTSLCKHLQCFDAEAFLEMNRSKSIDKWRCPICSSAVVSLASLTIEKYFMTVLGATSKNDVSISPDGTWTDAREEKEIPVITID